MSRSQTAFRPRRIPTTPDHHHRPTGARPRGRLLCFGHILPCNPPRAGNELRIAHLLRWFMAEGWDVLLAACTPPMIEPSEDDLRAASTVYRNLVVCFHDGTVWHAGDEVGGMIDGLPEGEPREAAPASTDDPSWQRDMCPDIFVALLGHLDAGWSPAIHLAQYIGQARAFSAMRSPALRIVDTMDAFSTFRRQLEPHGFAYTDVSEEQEGSLLQCFDIVIAIHSDDAELFARLAPESAVVTIGVDVAVSTAFEPASNPVVLLVAYDNPLNARGLIDFLALAWPRVVERVPQAQLRIAGYVGRHVATPPANVEVIGFVDDLAVEYRNAKVVINPAFVGTGLKIKTIEALAQLRPVVTWQAGVDGMDAGLQQFCRIAASWDAFADQVASILEDDDVAAELHRQRSLLERTFATEAIYRPLGVAMAAYDANR